MLIGEESERGYNVVEVNPLKRERLRLNLSQQQLAKFVQVTPGAILKYEQGLYENPSDNIVFVLRELAKERGWNVPLDIYQQYRNWRKFHQESKAFIFDRRHTLAISADKSPFDLFRQNLPVFAEDGYTAVGKGYTVQGFAVLLCIHPSTVANYQKSEKYSNMSPLLHEALTNAQMPTDQIRDLEVLGKLWLQNKK